MRKLLFLMATIAIVSCGDGGGVFEDQDVMTLDELRELNQKALSFEDAGDFHGDLLAVKADGMWGLLNYKTDELVIGFKYDTISYNNKGWWSLSIHDAWAVSKSDVADENGNILKLNENNNHTMPLSKDLLLSTYEKGTNIKRVLVDSKLNPVLKDTFFYVSNNEAGNNIVLSDDKNSCFTLVSITDNGVVIKKIKDKYKAVNGCPDEGLYSVTDSADKYGFINRDGKVIVPCKYGDIEYYGFENGLAVVGDSWDAVNTIIKTDGTEVLKIGYAKRIHPFSEGFAAVEKEDGCAFIDKGGKIQFELSDVSCFSRFVNGVAIVIKNGEDEFGADSKFGVINKKGDYIIPLQDEHIDEAHMSNGFIVVCDNVISDGGKYGLFNLNGERLLETKYDLIAFSSKGVIRVKINGHSYYVNTKGETGLSNLEEAIAKGEEARKDFLTKHADMRFNLMWTIENNIFYMFDRVSPNILKDKSAIKNLTQEKDGTYSAQVEFETKNGQYFYKLSNMKFNEKGHFEDSFDPWKTEITFVPNMERVDPNAVYVLPFHLPNAEEQLMYYNEKLMQGNRYNPYK